MTIDKINICFRYMRHTPIMPKRASGLGWSFYMRARAWTWTLNNYQSDELETLLRVGQNLEKNIKYMCWGHEVGEEGTPHLQGFVYFTNARSMRAVKNILGSLRFHLEKSRGTPQENKLYCQKMDPRSIENGVEPNEIFHEFGDLPQQGRRGDLEEVKEELDAGMTLDVVATNYFPLWIRYRQSFEAYLQLKNRPRLTPSFQMTDFPTSWQNAIFNWDKSIVIWGKSGIGKTQFAITLLPNALMVSHMDDLRNFDGSFHSGIIFDDVDVKHFPRTSQIHLVDQDHDRSIHIRYGCAIIPKKTKKIFTTNEDRGWCLQLDDDAIKRRVEVHYLDR